MRRTHRQFADKRMNNNFSSPEMIKVKRRVLGYLANAEAAPSRPLAAPFSCNQHRFKIIPTDTFRNIERRRVSTLFATYNMPGSTVVTGWSIKIKGELQSKNKLDSIDSVLEEIPNGEGPTAIR